MWPNLYTPRGKIKYEKLNYRITNLQLLTQDLQQQQFSGYMEILAPHEKGLLFFHTGRIVNCFYEGTQDLQLDREQILQHFFRTQTAERETIVNAYELDPAVITALSALEKRPPAHRELETTFLDLPRLFGTLSRKHFTGVLRFYRIRNNTRLGNLLVRSKKITPDQLKEAVRQQLSEEGALRLGDALVKIKAITMEDLQWALNRQSLTRKGSDVETALALFFEGEFLGGITPSGEVLVPDAETVMTLVNVPDIFMDIVDGILPSTVSLQDVKPATESEATKTVVPLPLEEEIPHPDDIILEVQAEPGLGTELPGSAFATLESVHAKPDPQPLVPEYTGSGKKIPARIPIPKGAEIFENGKTIPLPANDSETMDLSGDRLKVSLDMPGIGLPSAMEMATLVAKKPAPVMEPSAPVAEPSAPVAEPSVPVAEPSAPVAEPPAPVAEPPAPVAEPPAPVAEPPADSPLPASTTGPEETGPASREASGYSLAQEILDHYMGFLGTALLERECRKVEASGRQLTPSQLRRLCQNLMAPASYLVGPSRAQIIIQHIKERIGG